MKKTTEASGARKKSKPAKTKFFTFVQNNSGGSFHFDRKRGITHFVIVEASDLDAAIDRAESIGLYFDGAGDCPCCGYRWSTYAQEALKPSLYGVPVRKKYKKTDPGDIKWIKGPEAFIHYLDGRIVAAEE